MNKDRNFEVGDVVLHFKWEETKNRFSNYYIIEAFATDSSTLKEVVMYTNITNGKTWVRDREEFESKVDKNKYPNIKQKYRFIKFNAEKVMKEMKHGSN